MKSLENIQKTFNACKIISKIGKICCIVGAAMSAAGIFSLAVLPEALKLGGVTIKGLVEKSDDMSMGDTYTALAVAIVYCVLYAILCNVAEKYFTHELAAGTPFTSGGAKELRVLGLYTICLPIIANFGAQIICQIMQKVLSDVSDFPTGNYGSVAFGLAIIVMSMICQYGAETKDNNAEPTEANDEDISA